MSRKCPDQADFIAWQRQRFAAKPTDELFTNLAVFRAMAHSRDAIARTAAIIPCAVVRAILRWRGYRYSDLRRKIISSRGLTATSKSITRV